MSDMPMIDLDQDDDQIESLAKELFEDEIRGKRHADITSAEEQENSDSKKKKKRNAKKTGKREKKRNNQKKGKWNPVAVLLLLSALAGIGTSFYFYGQLCEERNINRANSEAIATSSQVISDKDGQILGEKEQSFQDGYSEGVALGEQNQLEQLKETLRANTEEYGVLKALRELYPECVVFYDTTGYVFADIDESIGFHSYKEELFEWDEDGFVDYVEDGSITSKRGIDVSKYNEEVDWNLVKESGIEFAFVRVGFRGYGSGDILLDEMFESHITGAKKAGLKVGVYFFTEAINAKEAEEEAQFVLDQLKEVGIKPDYPIVLDVEKVNVSSARAENLSKEDRTEVAIAFCEKIRKAGYTPMIYGNIKCFINMLDLSLLKDYPKWFAYYDESIYFPYELSCWQYSEKGIVDGVKGEVDINILLDDSFLSE